MSQMTDPTLEEAFALEQEIKDEAMTDALVSLGLAELLAEGAHISGYRVDYTGGAVVLTTTVTLPQPVNYISCNFIVE